MLNELLEKVLQAGGEELEIEQKARKEWLTAFNGPVRFGIGSLDSEHAKRVFKEMAELKKRKQVRLGSRTYALRFREFQCFGEAAYRIQMEAIGPNKSVHRIAHKSGSP